MEYAPCVLHSLYHLLSRCTSHSAQCRAQATCTLFTLQPRHYSTRHMMRRCTTQSTLHAYSLHTSRRITTMASISRPYSQHSSQHYTVKPNTLQLCFTSQLCNELHNY
ncbi:hypothetical protein I3843_13G099800 [Carya illinoinensis]|nr:hypothetical protein I3843_13G099800 [Carya illinoinensis]